MRLSQRPSRGDGIDRRLTSYPKLWIVPHCHVLEDMGGFGVQVEKNREKDSPIRNSSNSSFPY